MTIQQVIRGLVKEWERHPFDINQGECGEFAYQVTKEFHGAFLHSGADTEVFCIDPAWYELEGTHCFVEFQGRYFDAEAPDGVSRPEFLPLFMWQWAPKLIAAARKKRNNVDESRNVVHDDLDIVEALVDSVSSLIEDAMDAARESCLNGMGDVITLLKKAKAAMLRVTPEDP